MRIRHEFVHTHELRMLAGELGVTVAEAGFMVIRLWAAFEGSKKDSIKMVNKEVVAKLNLAKPFCDLSVICGWEGDVEKFRKAMVRNKFVEFKDGKLWCLPWFSTRPWHDWNKKYEEVA